MKETEKRCAKESAPFEGNAELCDLAQAHVVPLRHAAGQQRAPRGRCGAQKSVRGATFAALGKNERTACWRRRGRGAPASSTSASSPSSAPNTWRGAGSARAGRRVTRARQALRALASGWRTWYGSRRATASSKLANGAATSGLSARRASSPASVTPCRHAAAAAAAPAFVSTGPVAAGGAFAWFAVDAIGRRDPLCGGHNAWVANKSERRRSLRGFMRLEAVIACAPLLVPAAAALRRDGGAAGRCGGGGGGGCAAAGRARRFRRAAAACDGAGGARRGRAG